VADGERAHFADARNARAAGRRELCAKICVSFPRGAGCGDTGFGKLAFPVTAVTANWHLLEIRRTVSQIAGVFVPAVAATILTFVGLASSNVSRAQPYGGTPGEHAA